MAEQRIKDLHQHGDKLWTKRNPLDSLWQEMADNFYPERADFTMRRPIGQNWADNLITSHPLLARRELGNAFSGMLRPSTKQWFHTHTMRPDREEEPARAWLQMTEQVMRRAMYDRVAQLTRATKEGDHDFATFGQCVLSAELAKDRSTLLYRCWHLRDVVWCEDASGAIADTHRRWKPYARDAVKMFPKASQELKTHAEKDPYEEVELRHVVMKAEDYEPPADGKKWRTPWVSIYFEPDSDNVLEEVGLYNRMYVIPRWQTVSGSQYAHSAATIIALPDARLIQSITLTLLEAGEKSSNPPLIAVDQMVRSDLATYAGGVTWVDAEYDERLGEVLRPISQDYRGLPNGIEMQKDIRNMIAEAFYLNKLSPLPQTDNPDMTAYETGQRVQDYIRQALPLFEPMELEYNGALCDVTFDLMLRGGAFGSFLDMPQALRGADIQFTFESPLTEAIERQAGQSLLETKAMVAEAAQIDPTVVKMVDWRGALRGALRGIGTPAIWMRTPEQMAVIDQTDAQQAQVSGLVNQATAAGTAAKTVGEGVQALKQAGLDQAA